MPAAVATAVPVAAAVAVEAGIGADSGPSAEEIRRTVLPNGIRVVTEHMPGTRSVTTGFWVAIGARDEPAEIAGVSHFLEHLLFKGTEARTARQIAEAVDAVGGEMNAFTSREYTAYYTRLPDAELDLGLDILSDVLTAPAFRDHEIEAERQVILEEILMDEDSPEDRVHTLLSAALFPDHPLGRDVAGEADTVTAIERPDIRTFFDAHYRPRNLVVAAAGNLDHERVVAGVRDRFGDDEGGEPPHRAHPSVPPRPLEVLRRPTEQAHVAMGFRALGRRDPDRYALAVLNHVLGGGMSSRLFQEIREQRGLVYSVYSGVSSYSDTGALSIYAGTGPGRAREVIDLLDAEIDRLLSDGITEGELKVAKGYLEGSLVLGMEDSGGRMSRLGSAETRLGETISVDQQVQRYREVTLDDVRRVTERVLGASRTLAVVGPFDAKAFRDRVGISA